MKNLALTLAGCLLTSTVAHAAFDIGSLYVERLGDGSTALSSASTSISILGYSGTTLQTTWNLASTGSSRLTDSGSATSNGYLSMTTDRQSLLITGYDANLGTASVAGGAGIARRVQVLDSTGTITDTYTTATTGSWQGNNFRSVAGTDRENIWGSGAGTTTTGGIRYFDDQSSTSTTLVATGATNTRVVGIFDGGLYYSTGSGTSGIYSLGALPTTATTPTALIATGSGSSPYSFSLFDTNNDDVMDVAFIADDRTSAGGGLQRWDFDGSLWSNTYSLLLNPTGNALQSTGTGLLGLRGLSVSFDDASDLFTIYGTTTESSNNRLISITTGLAGTPTTWDQIATAGSNYVFRGVVTAVPEPHEYALAVVGLLFVMVLVRRARAAHAA
jgi:hypothetical protein